MRIFLMLFFLAGMMCGSSGVQAAEKRDVRRVVEAMSNSNSSVYHTSIRVASGVDTTVSFVQGGLRYILVHYREDVTNEESLFVTVYPDRVGGDKLVEMFMDNNLDGCVDLGKDGPGPPWGRLKEEKDLRPHYQTRYDQAIKEALRTLK